MATYVLGVGDRHSDNIMVKKTGQVGLLEPKKKESQHYPVSSKTAEKINHLCCGFYERRFKSGSRKSGFEHYFCVVSETS